MHRDGLMFHDPDVQRDGLMFHDPDVTLIICYDVDRDFVIIELHYK